MRFPQKAGREILSLNSLKLLASPTGESSNPPDTQGQPEPSDLEALLKTLEDWNEQLKHLKDKGNLPAGGLKP